MGEINEDNIKVPNWLENLEKLREKRLQRRLGHETGAGAPCLNCSEKCPGLDLHFWRKICKICKCSKDSHNVEDDDTCGWVQFQLLGTKPIKSRNVLLPGHDLDWTPPGASAAIERYLQEMPHDKIAITGSEAAKRRQQRLQNQIPAHDLDATLCDGLSPAELKQMNEYISHIKQHCVGQGKLVELPLIRVADHHDLDKCFAKLVTDHTPISQIVNSEQVALKTARESHALNSSKNAPKDGNGVENANNVHQPENTVCHQCGQPIFDGDIAITVDRTDAKWHPKCFMCYKCNQPLEDLVYFFDKKSKQIYCGRDYASIKGIPRCAACDELIFLREYCLAEDRVFHVKHFCCWECDTPLAGEQYLIEDGNPMCLPCFKQNKAAVCRHCNSIIGPDEQGCRIEDVHWHTPRCFICRKCKTSLGKQFIYQDGYVYCSRNCAYYD